MRRTDGQGERSRGRAETRRGAWGELLPTRQPPEVSPGWVWFMVTVTVKLGAAVK